MRWKHMIVVGALLGAGTQIAAADVNDLDDASDEVVALVEGTFGTDPAFSSCKAASDPDAIYVAETGTYERVYQSGAVRYVEIWQETNGLAGLQTSRGMACMGPADTLLASACVGRCAIMI
jgi:hypothetical protein